jgi:hypothetical protein
MGVRVLEGDAVRGQPVDGRRVDELRAVDRKVIGAKRVDRNEDDRRIRKLSGARFAMPAAGQEECSGNERNESAKETIHNG